MHFRFNGWGEKFAPYANDARVPELLAGHLGIRRYVAPLVLEGGAFFVDGEGTLLTTEQCLLHENRNPGLSRAELEQTLGDYLGVEHCLWLGEGHYEDFVTDGHVDDIAHFLAPGRVIVHAPSNPAHPDHGRGADNVARLAGARDARGRSIEVVPFDTGAAGGIPYLNAYVCNGGVIVPVAGVEEDAAAVTAIARVLSRPRGRDGGRGSAVRVRRRRSALHHAAGAGGHVRPGVTCAARVAAHERARTRRGIPGCRPYDLAR